MISWFAIYLVVGILLAEASVRVGEHRLGVLGYISLVLLWPPILVVAVVMTACIFTTKWKKRSTYDHEDSQDR